MAEATNDLLLQVPRQVQADLAEMKTDMAEMRLDMKGVDQKVDGPTIMLVGHVHHTEERVDAPEARK